MQTPVQKLDPLVIAAGGQDYEIQDGTGATVIVRVRLLKLSEYQDYVALQGRPEALAAFLISRPIEWVDSLPAISTAAIISLGHELNFQGACLWAERLAATAEASVDLVKNWDRIQAKSKIKA